MSHPGFVLLLLQLLQSLVDALTEEPEIRPQSGKGWKGSLCFPQKKSRLITKGEVLLSILEVKVLTNPEFFRSKLTEGGEVTCLVEHRLPGDSSVAGSPWEMIPITF